MLEVLVTALLSAGLTLAGAYFITRRALEAHLVPYVEAEVDRRLAEVGDVIEARVRQGVVKAVEDVTSPESLQQSMEKGQNTLLNAIFGKDLF